MSKEELIVEQQLEQLARLSDGELLDLAATKQLELLVKLKLLLAEKPTEHVRTTNSPAESLSDDALLQQLRSVKLG